MRLPSTIGVLALLLASMLLPAQLSPGVGDLADPGPYQYAGWQQVTVTRPDSSTFTARLYYPATSSGQGAPYNDSGAPYPAISFGHGFLTAQTYYQSTLAHLATWGYFVIATESGMNLFPNHQAYADDLRHCLTHLEGQNADPGSPYYQDVDTAHLGLTGHSMGGGASILATAADARVRAMAALAAAETNPSAIAVMPDIQVPVRLLFGDEDGIVNWEQNTLPMYNAGNPARQLPRLVGGWHCGFLDSDMLFCDSGPLDRATQLAVTRRLLTGFFNLYLHGDQPAWREVWGPERCGDPIAPLQAEDAGHDLGPSTQAGQALEGTAITYTLHISNPVNAVVMPNPTELVIIDQGVPTVQFSAAAYSVGEGEGFAVVTVTLSHPYTWTVSVCYTPTAGTATPGEDYGAGGGGLYFRPGMTQHVGLVISVYQDALVEGPETLTLSLFLPTNATIGEPGTAVLTIVDDDVVPAFWIFLPLVVKG